MLPQDPIILLSYVNLKLRDFYPSLDAFCEDQEIDKDELCNKLHSYGFDYEPKYNKFL